MLVVLGGLGIRMRLFSFLIDRTSSDLIMLGAPFLSHSALVLSHFSVVQNSCGTPKAIDLRASVVLVLALFTFLKRCGNSKINSIGKQLLGRSSKKGRSVERLSCYFSWGTTARSMLCGQKRCYNPLGHTSASYKSEHLFRLALQDCSSTPR